MKYRLYRLIVLCFKISLVFLLKKISKILFFRLIQNLFQNLFL